VVTAPDDPDDEQLVKRATTIASNPNRLDLTRRS